jgi:hypothetical protein
MKITYAALAAVAALAIGCTNGDYTGTGRGIDIEVDTLLWGSVNTLSTTYKKATELPLGTLHVGPNGLDMTGPGVEIWARMSFCQAAPNAEECN